MQSCVAALIRTSTRCVMSGCAKTYKSSVSWGFMSRSLRFIAGLLCMFGVGVGEAAMGSEWDGVDLCQLNEADYSKWNENFHKKFSGEVAPKEFRRFVQNVKNAESFIERDWVGNPIFGNISVVVYDVRCRESHGNENIWRFEGVFSSDVAPPQGQRPIRFRLLFDADENFAARKIPFALDNFRSASGMVKALMSVLTPGASREEVRLTLDKANIKFRNSHVWDGKRIDVYMVKPDPLFAYIGLDDGQLIFSEHKLGGELIELRAES